MSAQTDHPLDPSPTELAKEAGLRYITDDIPGISRLKKGDKFDYLDRQGEKITDPKILDRINALGIPPAWRNVWVCPSATGHIQATGIDEKGRKQYRYHAEWIKLSQEKKFGKMLFFSEVLPTLRRKVASDMRLPGLPEQKVLATIIWLLGKTYIRVGNDEYAQENQHYGLTTLRNKHVDVHGSTVTFQFVGKSGKKHKIGVEDKKVAGVIRKLEELPGYELFQYIDIDGHKRVVDSANVNDYLQKVTGDGISAKDFRTWGGTVLSAVTLNDLGEFETDVQAQKNIVQAVKTVASYLRNTVAVCKSYYIHPVVPKSYQSKILLPHFLDMQKRWDKKPDNLSRDEYAVALLLKDQA